MTLSLTAGTHVLHNMHMDCITKTSSCVYICIYRRYCLLHASVVEYSFAFTNIENQSIG